jgi:hypothetical protein
MKSYVCYKFNHIYYNHTSLTPALRHWYHSAKKAAELGDLVT